MRFRLCRLVICSWIFGLAGVVNAAEPAYEPDVKPASPAAKQALAGFRLPEATTLELVAAEPDVANPVAFCIDEQGRFFVCETFRQKKGVEDNRGHSYWLQDDLMAQTVEDRRAYILKHHADEIAHYTDEHDRIRRLVDTDGDGVLDKSTVFVTGFNDVVDGTGAGVLAVDGDVYYTCIPKLWKFRDDDGDGTADTEQILADGFGVRFAFRGHDMHGLTLGPDGRIYFSIGDRGYSVLTAEGRTFHRPDTGAVFRCERDGSELEVFAYGLRNPQELAFDDVGNLFTGDNNSDSGDKARWVYVCEGADSGWRMNFQYLSDRGPWNRERMWYPYRSDEETTAKQPAYIVPPIANLGDGPSGLVAYYGVGLPDKYNGHFFLADFRGQSVNSGIRSFTNTPKGAGFELADSEQYLWRALATDVDFGFDGRMYFTDWVNGWDGLGRGRIYRSVPEDPVLQEAGDQVATLFKVGFQGRPVAELTELLGHADRRVRQRAQFELVRQDETKLLQQIAIDDSSLQRRIHAIWGLGQIGRTVGGQSQVEVLTPLVALLDDESDAIAQQAARVFGDCRFEPAEVELIAQLNRPDARGKYFAAVALGRLQSTTAIDDLMNGLVANADADPVLRHGYVMGLTGAGASDVERLLTHAEHSSRSARLGVLLALRRLKHAAITQFLTDGDPALVLEAARAIHDEPLFELYPELAALPLRSGQDPELQRRIVDANDYLGGSENALRLTQFAADSKADPAQRLEAIDAVLNWENPQPNDRITNHFRGLKPRDAAFLKPIVTSYLGSLMNGPQTMQTKVIELAAKLGIDDVAPVLREILADGSQPNELRVAALEAYDRVEPEQSRADVRSFLQSDIPEFRSAARSILIVREPEAAVELITQALELGTVAEQQSALDQLAKRDDAASIDLLSKWVNRLVAGDVAPAVELDIIMAAERSGEPAVTAVLDQYRRRLAEKGPWAEYQVCATGGDAERGAEIFFGRATASCRRCHAVNGQGGGVGPDLSEIAKTNSREYLLESIVHPNAKIAKGFETVLVVTVEGKIVSGILKEETEEFVTLIEPLGEVVRIAQDDIEDRAVGQSGMPADLAKQLTKSEIRDVVEYLATLKKKQDVSAHGNEE